MFARNHIHFLFKQKFMFSANKNATILYFFLIVNIESEDFFLILSSEGPQKHD
jgi:hypothetical protein